MHILRSRLAAVALFVALGQIVPTSGWFVALAHNETGMMECTCVGDTHDPMCPMHSSPNAVRNDGACHVGTASLALPPVLGMAAVPEHPFEAERQPTAGPAPALSGHLLARSLPVDLPPPRA